MTGLVLVGSLAAKLHGILPPHRNGLTRDIDIIGASKPSRALADRLGAREYIPDRYIAGPWQIDGSAGTVNDMIVALNAQGRPLTIDGVNVTVGCPLTVMVIRCASIEHCGGHREKAIADSAHYATLLPPTLPDRMAALWDAIAHPAR